MTDMEKLKLVASGRCEHCGGLKKEHHRRAPYKCPTRLTESYYLPWDLESLNAALAVAAKKMEGR